MNDSNPFVVQFPFAHVQISSKFMLRLSATPLCDTRNGKQPHLSLDVGGSPYKERRDKFKAMFRGSFGEKYF